MEWVNTYKRLVVIISDDLRWVHHNEYISKKASKHLYSLRILERVGVANDSILRVCLTIFRPILEYGVIYCNEVNKRSLFIYLFIYLAEVRSLWSWSTQGKCLSVVQLPMRQ